ncbi:glyoxalase superfamily protein [Aeromicrobium sp.]|uniref:glyoxalase superfamily protein n=1 Tax=Aeromicrobium sp. TaxID=1871063 RepID=UPI003D6B9183
MEWTLEAILVPVSDLDRAKRFYSEQLGFAVDLDTQLSDDLRLVQLTPPGSGCSIHLQTGSQGMSPGSMRGGLVVVSDIEQAHAELVGRGAEVSNVGHYEGMEFVDGKGGTWNSFIRLSDPDGNEWSVQEAPADR